MYKNKSGLKILPNFGHIKVLESKTKLYFLITYILPANPQFGKLRLAYLGLSHYLAEVFNKVAKVVN